LIAVPSVSLMAHNILVVDDDPAVQKVLQQALQLEGYEVTTADDGEQALTALEARLPDIIVLDVMMPKVDGFEVLRRIRESDRTTNLPVILLTAKSATEDVWEGWRRGVDYYMTKPFDVEELLTFIKYVFEGGHQEPPVAD
jgi:DNA-binding response OmpR family regulator